MAIPNRAEVLLIAERSDLSADLVVAELTRVGVGFYRFNCDDFPQASTASWDPINKHAILTLYEKSIDLKKFTSAWYRRTPPLVQNPDIPQSVNRFVDREILSFLDGLWECSTVPWINRPANASRAENKLNQLSLAHDLGFCLPRTMVTNNPAMARSFVSAVPSAVVKSLTGGRLILLEDTWRLYTHTVSRANLDAGAPIQCAPCILQERINKRSDIRITVIGNNIYSAEIITGENQDVDWRAVDPAAITYRRHRIEVDLAERCQMMLSRLGLTYGAFDFILTPQGKYVFLELNPAGQWGWIEHELEYLITESIVQHLIRTKFE